MLKKCNTSCQATQARRNVPAFSSRSRAVTVRAALKSNDAAESSDRRQVLLSLAAASASVLSPSLAPFSAIASEGTEYKTFYGLATPPTSYGGYGGNANEVPKYTFEYPSTWKEEVPSKVEKGTQGIDGRVVNPKGKDLRAFVITLGRAGEDNKSFILRDTDSTFAGFAGADYNLQDALTSATDIVKTKRTIDGIDFYDYDIDSPDFRYLSSVAVKDGKVFALFVRSPTRVFKRNEEALRHMQETFRLL